jgi:hypothetical protein
MRHLKSLSDCHKTSETSVPHMRFVVDNMAEGGFLTSTAVSPTNYSIKCFTVTNHSLIDDTALIQAA